MTTGTSSGAPLLWIHGMGHFHPENVITNRFLEDLDIGTSEQWILERVGILERRTVLPLDYIRQTRNRDPRAAGEAAIYSNAATGARAAQMALERAGLTASDIGLVLSGSCSPDTTAPAEACRIAAELGIAAPAVDLNSACSTFGAHLHWLASMRPQVLPRFALVVLPENTTRVVCFDDRRSAVLWGDGSCAAVVSATERGRVAVLRATVGADPAAADMVSIPRTGHFRQNGRAVQKFAIRKTAALLGELQRDVRPAGIHLHFIGHQANALMLDAVRRACGVPAGRHHANVAWFGNTGAAGAPSVLSMRWEWFRPGDHIAMVTVGAGLAWSSALLRIEDGPATTSVRQSRPTGSGN